MQSPKRAGYPAKLCLSLYLNPDWLQPHVMKETEPITELSAFTYELAALMKLDGTGLDLMRFRLLTLK